MYLDKEIIFSLVIIALTIYFLVRCGQFAWRHFKADEKKAHQLESQPLSAVEHGKA